MNLVPIPAVFIAPDKFSTELMASIPKKVANAINLMGIAEQDGELFNDENGNILGWYFSPDSWSSLVLKNDLNGEFFQMWWKNSPFSPENIQFTDESLTDVISFLDNFVVLEKKIYDCLTFNSTTL